MCHTQWWVYAGWISSFLGPWAHEWINHWSLRRMASATPDLRLPSQPQASPSLDRCQITLIGDRGACMWTTCPRLLSESARPGVEPATFWLASPTRWWYGMVWYGKCQHVKCCRCRSSYCMSEWLSVAGHAPSGLQCLVDFMITLLFYGKLLINIICVVSWSSSH